MENSIKLTQQINNLGMIGIIVLFLSPISMIALSFYDSSSRRNAYEEISASQKLYDSFVERGTLPSDAARRLISDRSKRVSGVPVLLYFFLGLVGLSGFTLLIIGRDYYLPLYDLQRKSYDTKP